MFDNLNVTDLEIIEHRGQEYFYHHRDPLRFLGENDTIVKVTFRVSPALLPELTDLIRRFEQYPYHHADYRMSR